MEMRWQGYHRIISHPKHYRALEMEIRKLNVPAIQSTHGHQPLSVWGCGGQN